MRIFKFALLMMIVFVAGRWSVSVPAGGQSPQGPEHAEGGGHAHDGEGDEPGHEEHEEHGEHGEHEGHSDDPEGRIVLTREARELAGIETTAVVPGAFARKIAVTGRIAQDVDHVEHIFSPVEGVMKECFVQLGQQVAEGDPLCVVQPTSGAPVEIKAPAAGLVMADFIEAGSRVDPATSIHTIADVRVLSANFDVYEQDVAHIRMDQKVLIYPLAYPGRSFQGTIVFISPRVDESTYTVKIKVKVQNTDQLLKAGMFLKGEILVEEEGDALTVPAEAVQVLGDKSVVFVRSGEDAFEAREVSVQQSSRDAVALQGVTAGEEIAVKGTFILKSKLLESEMEHAHSH